MGWRLLALLVLLLVAPRSRVRGTASYRTDIVVLPPRPPAGSTLNAVFYVPDPWLMDDMRLHRCGDRAIQVTACGYGRRCNVTGADAVLFSLWRLRMRHVPPVKYTNQPWILYTNESPIQTNRMLPWNRLPPLNSVAWRMFDLFWNYRLDADISEPYIEPDTEAYWRSLFRDSDFHRRNQDVPVLWLARNCNSASSCRVKYIRELMKHIPVHSYGRCLNNRGNVTITNKTALMLQYKFYLSFENSDCRDYCTEKLMDCYRTGAIPVVMGCWPVPMPHARAAIHVRDFASPRHLAEHLLAVSRNETLYRQHRVASTLSPRFVRHFVVPERRSVWCRVIDAVLRFQAELARRPLHGSHVNPDFSCRWNRTANCYGA